MARMHKHTHARTYQSPRVGTSSMRTPCWSRTTCRAYRASLTIDSTSKKCATITTLVSGGSARTELNETAVADRPSTRSLERKHAHSRQLTMRAQICAHARARICADSVVGARVYACICELLVGRQGHSVPGHHDKIHQVDRELHVSQEKTERRIRFENEPSTARSRLRSHARRMACSRELAWDEAMHVLSRGGSHAPLFAADSATLVAA